MRQRVAFAVLVVAILTSVVGAQESVNFGAVPLNTTSQVIYTLTNTNPFSCNLEAFGFGEEFSLESGSFSVYPMELPLAVQAGDSLPLTLTFLPKSAGTHTAELRIRLRCGIFGQNLTIPLLGQGGQGGTSPGDVMVTDPTLGSTDCGCSNELSSLSGQVANLTSYVQLQLAPALQQVQAELQQVELTGTSNAVADGTAGGACPGPFPSAAGQRFLEFVTAQRSLAIQAASDLPRIDCEEPEQQALLQAGVSVLQDLTAELDTVTQQVLSLAPDYLDCLDSYVPPSTVQYTDAVLAVAEDPTTHPKLRALFESSGMNVGETVWDKVKIWVGHIPGVGGILESAMEDIDALTDSAGDTLAIAGMLFQYEIERKLDAIIYGLFGIEIPPNATESELYELLRLIPRDSIVDRLNRLEDETNENGDAIGDLAEDVGRLSGTVDRIQETVQENNEEIAILESKVCCFIWAMNRFGQELGDALYNDRETFSDMLPTVCEGTTYARCFGLDTTTAEAHPDEFQRDAIKPEIPNLEPEMAIVRGQLTEILRRLGDPDLIPVDETPPTITPPPTTPVDETTTDRNLLLVTKKIYVYAEGTFEATSSGELRDIIVTTPAFDVSGWLDATQLRTGDEIQVELTVRIDGQDRHFLTTTFVGGADTRLIYFDELTAGRTFIVGSWIRIRITQTVSADEFASTVPVGYQFIVQSQR